MKEDTSLSSQEMVKRTNQYLEEVGLDDEILGMETSQDKVLYYYNYIDKNNIFKGILVLPSYYYIKLSNLLCNTTERLNLFYDKFYDADGNVAEQFRLYRRYLLDNREKTEEYLGIMDKMIKGECWSALFMTLQELFLEPFEKWIFDRLVDMIHNGLTAEDIYKLFLQRRNVKSIITYSIPYIKQLTNL
jgi:hypothetical protein